MCRYLRWKWTVSYFDSSLSLVVLLPYKYIQGIYLWRVSLDWFSSVLILPPQRALRIIWRCFDCRSDWQGTVDIGGWRSGVVRYFILYAILSCTMKNRPSPMSVVPHYEIPWISCSDLEGMYSIFSIFMKGETNFSGFKVTENHSWVSFLFCQCN